ncbi:MAG: hypothetical protein ACRDI2_13060 [Chloroflexota bacterium]
MPVRTTVHLDERLVERLRHVAPPRGLNRFINDALVEKLDALERQRIEQAMREGYLATRRDRAELDADWQVVDTEGWPE